jgi:hypothetical protein
MWGLIMVLLLTACQPLTRTPPPTPEVLRVQYTPSLRDWTADLNRCATRLPLIGLLVTEVPVNRLDLTQAELALRFGPADKTSGYASVVGWDEVVVIVNPANPTASLAPSVISGIYSGKIQNWMEVMKGAKDQSIRVWSYLARDDQRQIFDLAFLDGKALSKQAYQAPDPIAMLEAVAKDPYAIGYILKSQLDQSVRQVGLEGATENSLRQPILALAQKEPQGNLRQLLLCLQNP